MSYSKPLTLLFTGGGNRFYAFVGVLKGLREKGLVIGKVIGSSTGSLIAALVATGRSYDEIVDVMLDLDTDRFRDHKPRGLSRRMGLFAGGVFEEWLGSIFGDRTFRDGMPIPLQVITTDIQNYRPIVFSRDHFADTPIATACRASASIPWVFSPLPLTLRGREVLLIDGSLMSGLIEMGLARSESDRTLTFKVVSKRSLQHPGVPRGDWKGYWEEVFAFYLHAQEKEFIKGGAWRDNILIHCGDISPVQFTLSREQRLNLMEEGYLQTIKYLEYKCGL